MILLVHCSIVQAACNLRKQYLKSKLKANSIFNSELGCMEKYSSYPLQVNTIYIKDAQFCLLLQH
jgi:hypothetical protein